MEQYREKIKIQTITFGFLALILALCALGAALGELGIIPFPKPVSGDSSWASTWRGFITGASFGVLAVMIFGLIRNAKALKQEDALKKLYIKEHDERTIQIVTLARNTAMQILLLMGLAATVITGFFSMTVSITIMICTFVGSAVSLLLMGYYSKKY